MKPRIKRFHKPKRTDLIRRICQETSTGHYTPGDIFFTNKQLRELLLWVKIAKQFLIK
jgi:hypothetical protein